MFWESRTLLFESTLQGLVHVLPLDGTVIQYRLACSRGWVERVSRASQSRTNGEAEHLRHRGGSDLHSIFALSSDFHLR